MQLNQAHELRVVSEGLGILAKKMSKALYDQIQGRNAHIIPFRLHLKTCVDATNNAVAGGERNVEEPPHFATGWLYVLCHFTLHCVHISMWDKRISEWTISLQ